ALDAEKLGSVWGEITGMAGSYKSVKDAQVSEVQGLHVVRLTCDFESATVPASVAFDAQGKIAGLRFGMPQTKAPWAPPGYAHPDSFTEQPVAVGEDPAKLTGTLTLPKGKGPFAAVVLVQGSGPHDQDETVGPNKPFKDFAWGLGSQGIAVLRYNKRTYQHPESFKGQFTVEQETVEDARAAARLLAARPEIDRRRIYVAGHSLGAMLAPRIASGDPQVAGIIIMAGNMRPLEDLIVEQVKYQVSLAGAPTPEGGKAIDEAEKTAAAMRDPNLKPGQTVSVLGAPIPGSYVLDLRAYDPARTASSLKIPILVMQGARDYQVRMADFDGWKKALAGDRFASFRLYPNLYHLFIPVPASDKTPLSSPADYNQPGHVAPEVIADAAAWIKGTPPPPGAGR
ncbi:MAG TPA: alpha/beta fold hydrolase, partial [Terriglobia bacterium]|nr:alpha/beta fold hydrolase [Terriglobia bacterium]